MQGEKGSNPLFWILCTEKENFFTFYGDSWEVQKTSTNNKRLYQVQDLNLVFLRFLVSTRIVMYVAGIKIQLMNTKIIGISALEGLA